jgi:hypothetical protein
MTDTELPDFDAMGRATPDPLAEPDPSAPYGRTEDGVLIDRNGKRAPYGLTKSGQRKHHPGKRGGTRPTAPRAPSRPSGRTITVKRRRGLVELTEIPKGVCLGLGYKTDNDALLAEAVTIEMHAEPMANALAELAEDNDRLATVVDRIIEVGPLAQIGMVFGAFLAQTARNFGTVPAPVAAMLGGREEPAELAAMARGTMQQATQAMMDNGQESAAAQ